MAASTRFKTFCRTGSLAGLALIAGTSVAQIPGLKLNPFVRQGAVHHDVVRTFKDGSGMLRLIVNGQPHLLRGGQCDKFGEMRSFNVGVVDVTHAVSGAADYVGLTVSHAGSFNSATLSIHLGGEKFIMSDVSGVIDGRGGSFHAKGKDMGPPHTAIAVTGSFACK